MEKVVEGIIESIKAEQGDLSDAQTAFNLCILHWQLVLAIMDRDHRKLVFDHGRLVGLSERMEVEEDGNPFPEDVQGQGQDQDDQGQEQERPPEELE